MEHDPGGLGVQAGSGGKRWHWLPVSPDDQPSQWANADIWEQYPLAGHPSPPPTPRPPTLYLMLLLSRTVNFWLVKTSSLPDLEQRVRHVTCMCYTKYQSRSCTQHNRNS